jgi:hypothetical protein
MNVIDDLKGCPELIQEAPMLPQAAELDGEVQLWIRIPAPIDLLQVLGRQGPVPREFLFAGVLWDS